MIRLEYLKTLLKGADAEYKIALYSKVVDSDSYTKTDEVVGQGYTAGGKTLGRPVFTEDSTSVSLSFVGPAEWKYATISAKSAMIYRPDTGAVLHIVSFGKTISSTNDAFKVDMPEDPLHTWKI